MYNKQRGRDERSHGETLRVPSPLAFFLFALSSSSSSSSVSFTPEIKELEGSESHRGVIRVFSSSAPSHRRGEALTGSVQRGGALLKSIMTRKLFCSWGVGGSSLTMQPG